MSKRSGSETRQRTEQVGVRLTPGEYDRLRERAATRGCSPGELLLAAEAEVAALREQVTAERDAEVQSCRDWMERSEHNRHRAEKAEAAVAVLAQAMWDARTALGFDPDGDTRFHSTDWTQIAAHHVREAREVRADHEAALGVTE